MYLRKKNEAQFFSNHNLEESSESTGRIYIYRQILLRQLSF